MFAGEQEVEKILLDWFGEGSFGGYMESHMPEVADALDSLLCMEASERQTFTDAMKLIDDHIKREKYRDDTYDRLRTSMSDYGTYAWDLSAKIRKNIDKADKKTA